MFKVLYEVFRSLEDDRTSVQWRHCVHAVLLEAPLPVKSAADRPNASTASNCTMPWIMELVWRFSDTVSSAICWSLVPAPPERPTLDDVCKLPQKKSCQTVIRGALPLRTLSANAVPY